MFVMEMKGFCCGISSSGSDNGAAVACCSTGFSLSFRHIVNDLIEKWVQSSVNGQTDGWMDGTTEERGRRTEDGTWNDFGTFTSSFSNSDINQLTSSFPSFPSPSVTASNLNIRHHRKNSFGGNPSN